ncbi:helix-hairpin-helix domain-containing protein [Clostridium disporicum]|uniref:helix-hairpin-helix domain-containing protein n=1 Tax=Clostridium disporicum TaxID=84024 RepID=UPI0034A4A4B0
MFTPKYMPSMALINYEVGERLTLTGICNTNTYYNNENGYGVYNFETEDLGVFKIKGSFIPELIEGQTYQLVGEIVSYKGERQLKIAQYIPVKPVNKKGVISYLKTLYGLKTKAELIYNTFGDNCIDILLKDPMLVASEIKGIGKKSVVKWQEQLKSLEDNQQFYITLLGYGISQKNATKLLDKHGEKILRTIEENPYLLMSEVKGYGFLKCDKIALNMGLAPDNPHRIKSSIKYILEDASTKGHCYLPVNELILNIISLLELKLSYNDMIEIFKDNKDEESVSVVIGERSYEINIENLKKCINDYESAKTSEEKNNAKYVYHEIEPGDVGKQINDSICNREIIVEDDKIYLKQLYFAERDFANNIKRLAIYNSKYKRSLVEGILDSICKKENYELEEMQRKACVEFNLSDSGVYILNGSAGTGKTFTLNLILAVSKQLNKTNKLPILAVAPTGKASKVASKSIGMECLTIHRALGFNPVDGFVKNECEPFEQSTIVCDEGSMIDIELGSNFVKAIQTGSKVIIMGDTKQLPSVGAGNVLKDLIECGLVKVITLNVVKRQGLLSGIVENANRIINSKMIYTSKTNDFYVLERLKISEVQSCVKTSINRILTFPDYTIEEIQVLLPQRTGSLGVNMFNYLLQAEFNPYKGGERVLKGKFEAKLNEASPISEFSLYIQKGDKVMHIKNNYSMKLYEKDLTGAFKEMRKTGITNGESGIVENVIKTGKTSYRIIVKYDDYYVFYEDGVDELELSFATTIHKSQGSAWKAVVLPIVPQHTNMLSNNLVYTGVTRARDFCVVVGSTETMKRAINTHEVVKRYTNLQTKICA